MLYVCIPTHDEAPTIGVLLWRIRSVFQEYPRDYEVVVYDDGSTDATAEVLEPYAKVLPLTVIGGRERRGYAAAVDALCRHVAGHTRYPRRDALILMQGDFTDRPEHIPELVKRFEGGADMVVAEHADTESTPVAVRRLRRASRWILRPLVRIEGIADPTATMRLLRVAVVRDLLRERGDAPVAREAGWPANVELLLAAVPYARRVETVSVEQRFDVRPRATRLRPGSDALALAKFAWRLRGRARAAGSAVRGSPAPAPGRRRGGEDEPLGADTAAPATAPPPVPAGRPAADAPTEAKQSPPRKRAPRRPPDPAAAGDAAASAPGPVDATTAPAPESRPARPSRPRRTPRPSPPPAGDRTEAEAEELPVAAREPASAPDAPDVAAGEPGAAAEAGTRRRRSRRSGRRGRARRDAEGGAGEGAGEGAPGEPSDERAADARTTPDANGNGEGGARPEARDRAPGANGQGEPRPAGSMEAGE